MAIQTRSKHSLSPAEGRWMALSDRFFELLEGRGGQRAAEAFVNSLEKPMHKHTYAVDHGRLAPTMPAGGLIANAQSRYDVADAAWNAKRAEINAVVAELTPLRKRLPQLIDPDSFDDASEAAELQLRVSMLERRLAKLSASIEEGGADGHLKAERDAAHVNLYGAKQIEGNARAEIAELLKRLGPVLGDLYFATGSPADLSLLVEVRP